MIYSKLFCVVFALFLLSGLTINAQKSAKDSILIQIKNVRNQNVKSAFDKEYIDLINELATYYRYRNADSLRLLSEEALSRSLEIDYSKGKAFALLRNGDYYSDTGAELKALELYQQSKEIAFSLNSPELKVEVLNSIASQQYISQNLKNAVSTFYEAIDMASKSSLIELEAKLRHNLGYCYSNYKLYNEAQIEYLIADSLSSKLDKNHPLKAMTIANLALNTIENGDLEMGAIYMNNSFELLSKQNEPLWLSRAFRTKGRYYFKKKDYHKALEMMTASDSLLGKVYNPRDQMEIDIFCATIHFELGNWKKSKKKSLKALTQAIDFKDSLSQAKSHDNLEKIYDVFEYSDSAYIHYKKSKQIKEILRGNDEVQNVILLRAKMNFEKEKESLRRENLEKNLAQQKYMQWIASALIFAILLAIIIYKSQQKTRKLNLNLRKKTILLESNEKQLKEINTNQKKLFSIVGHDLKGPMLSLRELLKVMSGENNKEILLHTLLPKLNQYSDHVYFTVDNLLSWGEKQMKGEKIEPVAITLRAVTNHAIDLYSEPIDGKNLHIINDIDEHMQAWGNVNDIEVVFRNLVNNAVKFSNRKDNISISAYTDGNMVRIQFKDQGVGMSTAMQKKVLHSNGGYSTLGTNHEKGTGIGLMLCKELLLRNKGKMTIKSVVGQGTTISVLLPKYCDD